MIPYLLTFLAAAVLTIILTPLAIYCAKKWGIIDYPGERRIHKKPLPRFGGAAIYVAFWIAVFLNTEISRIVAGFFLGSSLIFVVGIVDDLKGMRPLYKLLWQIVAASIPLFFGLSVTHMQLPIIGDVSLVGSIPLVIIGYLFVIVWIVGLVNAVNISDGLDGLAGGVCFIASLILFWSAIRIGSVQASYLMLALAGATLGFLVFNFNPAKIIMGDSGSMFLGFMLGVVSIWGLVKTATVLGLVFPLLVLGMPIIDMLFAIIRRRWNGLSIAKADRGHLHHRLLDIGLTQRQAVFVLYIISVCFGLAAVISNYGLWYISLIIVILNLVIILRIVFRKFTIQKIFWKKKFYEKNRG
ncbi:MAG: glycosyltransferase family 4 protein [Desulfitobacteriia bacterium]|jgi:UDP-GlcNAc:undecaprenyl-phosphate GlcNAc-1-phosphate transferase